MSRMKVCSVTEGMYECYHHGVTGRTLSLLHMLCATVLQISFFTAFRDNNHFPNNALLNKSRQDFLPHEVLSACFSLSEWSSLIARSCLRDQCVECLQWGMQCDEFSVFTLFHWFKDLDYIFSTLVTSHNFQKSLKVFCPTISRYLQHTVKCVHEYSLVLSSITLATINQTFYLNSCERVDSLAFWALGCFSTCIIGGPAHWQPIIKICPFS